MSRIRGWNDLTPVALSVDARPAVPARRRSNDVGLIGSITEIVIYP